MTYRGVYWLGDAAESRTHGPCAETQHSNVVLGAEAGKGFEDQELEGLAVLAQGPSSGWGCFLSRTCGCRSWVALVSPRLLGQVSMLGRGLGRWFVSLHLSASVWASCGACESLF